MLHTCLQAEAESEIVALQEKLKHAKARIAAASKELGDYLLAATQASEWQRGSSICPPRDTHRSRSHVSLSRRVPCLHLRSSTWHGNSFTAAVARSTYIYFLLLHLLHF